MCGMSGAKTSIERRRTANCSIYRRCGSAVMRQRDGWVVGSPRSREVCMAEGGKSPRSGRPSADKSLKRSWLILAAAPIVAAETAQPHGRPLSLAGGRTAGRRGWHSGEASGIAAPQPSQWGRPQDPGGSRLFAPRLNPVFSTVPRRSGLETAPSPAQTRRHVGSPAKLPCNRGVNGFPKGLFTKSIFERGGGLGVAGAGAVGHPGGLAGGAGEVTDAGPRGGFNGGPH